MIDREKTVCLCNDLSIGDVATLIRERGCGTIEELLDRGVGNKCEACIEEGYDNDGCSLEMVMALVREGRL